MYKFEKYVSISDLKKFENKYEDDITNNLDKDNIDKIVEFLEIENCDFIENIIEDYLDLFILDSTEFIKKYKEINSNHNGMFLEDASEDMNLLEEFYV